jgi:hypothetical protein
MISTASKPGLTFRLWFRCIPYNIFGALKGILNVEYIQYITIELFHNGLQWNGFIMFLEWFNVITA